MGKRYEYMVVRECEMPYKWRHNAERLHDWLNELGRDGWRLVKLNYNEEDYDSQDVKAVFVHEY